MEWRGKGFCGGSIESQFTKYQYPASGYPHVQMYYRYGGSFIGTMTDTNRYVQAYRDGKVRLRRQPVHLVRGRGPLRRHHPAGLHQLRALGHRRLGVRLRLRRQQVRPVQPPHHRVPEEVHRAAGRIQAPTTRSSPTLADRLGVGDIYTEGGHTDLDWVKRMFNASDLSRRISWEEFEEKGYYVVPVPEETALHPGAALVRRGPGQRHPRRLPGLGPGQAARASRRPSGKIEFVSSSLTRFYETDGEDPERPAMGPQYIPSWEGHHTTELYEKYPLQMVSPHARFSFHTMGDGKGSLDQRHQGPPRAQGRRPLLLDHAPQHQGRGRAGHQGRRPHPGLQRPGGGHPVRPGDRARAAGNACTPTSRARDYLPVGEPGYSADKAGCVNLLTSHRFITPTSTGQAPNSCLIEVEKI